MRPSEKAAIVGALQTLSILYMVSLRRERDILCLWGWLRCRKMPSKHLLLLTDYYMA